MRRSTWSDVPSIGIPLGRTRYLPAARACRNPEVSNGALPPTPSLAFRPVFALRHFRKLWWHMPVSDRMPARAPEGGIAMVGQSFQRRGAALVTTVVLAL